MAPPKLKSSKKPLTPEEMKKRLLTQMAEAWLHSDPLCSFLPDANGPKIFPLDPKVESGILVVFLLDVGDYCTERALEVLSAWKEKYRGLNWLPILSFQQKYLFIKNPKFLERYRNMPQFAKTPIFIDPLGEWFETFGVKDQPVLLFFNKGVLFFKEALLPDFYKTIELAETQLQEALRLDDPGLPLPNVQKITPELTTDLKIIPPDALIQTGYWVPANRSLVTDDSHAALSFPFEGKKLRLMAVTHPQARESSRIQISFNHEPVPVSKHGAQVHLNDKGVAVMDINRASGIYELINSDEVLKGTIEMKFLNALENAVVIYELRTA